MKEIISSRKKIKMEALQIIDVIRGLSLTEKLYIVELIFKEIREEATKQENYEIKRREAAQLLLDDYQNDEELIAFTALDKEDFHETK